MEKTVSKLEGIKFIAFDMDGTIYTSDGILLPAYYKGIELFNKKHSYSLEKPSKEELEYQIGQPVRIIFSNLFPELRGKSELNILSELVLNVFLEMISDKGGKVFEGVHDTIEALYNKGYKLAVASNGRHAYLMQILKSFDLEKYFVPLVAINDDDISVKSDILKEYMRKYGIEKAEFLMVGDRTSDLEAAKEVDCSFIGCNYGFAADEIKDAEIVISNFGEILNYLPA